MAPIKDNKFALIGKRLKTWAQGDNTAKLFFLGLSIFLWFLINLSKDGYTAGVSYPVKYQQAPEGFRLVSEPPRFLKVQLKGHGFDIIKAKLKSLDPVEISLNSISLNDTNGFVWNPSDQIRIISTELGDKIAVTEIRPESIAMRFSPIEQRKFKVHLNYQKDFSKFKSFYRAPQIIPDSITVYGTASDLAQLDSINTELVRLTAEEDSVSIKAQLKLPAGTDLKFSKEEVRVNLVYTSLTEGTLEVPIRIRNLPLDYSVTIIPKKVKVTYQVPIKDFAKIEPSDFDISVDLKLLNKEAPDFLTLKASAVPALVRNYSLDPVRVEYILTK